MARVKILKENEPASQMVEAHHLCLVLLRVLPADGHGGKTGVKRDRFQTKSMARI